MMEKVTRKEKLLYVEDREASNLVLLIHQYIHPGSTIWSDKGGAIEGMMNFLIVAKQ